MILPICAFAKIDNSALIKVRCEDGANAFVKRISSGDPNFINWQNATVGNGNPLYDSSLSLIKAYGYIITKNKSEIGYLIVDTASGSILEYSQGKYPFALLDKALVSRKISISPQECKYYIYERPLEYTVSFAKIDNVEDKKLYSADDYYSSIEAILASESTDSLPITITSTTDNLSNSAATTIFTKIISGVPDKQQTTGCTCIPTSIVNLLLYWDAHGYPNLVTQSEADLRATVVAFVNFYGAGCNTSILPTIHAYRLTTYPNNFTTTNIFNPSFTQYKNEIVYGRPCCLGFASGGYYGEVPHMTTGVGYSYDSLFPERYSIVHDNHPGEVDVYILWTSYNDFMAKTVP